MVLGDLLTDGDKRFIFPSIKGFYEINSSIVEVIPETLSQLLYTTKQSDKFFDGDVVKHTYYEDFKVRVFFSEELLAVMGQVFDDDGEYELITLLPNDFEKHIRLC